MADTVQRMEDEWSCQDGFTTEFRPFRKLMDEVDDVARVDRNPDDGSSEVGQKEGIHS